MNAIQKLSEIFGLSAYEARVYAALIEIGPSLVLKISKHAGIPRTATYPPLEGLIRKGLVAQAQFSKRKYYSAIPTESLKSIFEKKQVLLNSVISELDQSRHISSKDSKLDATLYLGIEGIKSAGLIFLNETKKKVWYSFENFNKLADIVGFDFESFYIKERIKRNIKSKMILSVAEESLAIRNLLKEDKNHLRETILLSPNEYPFDTTIVTTEGLVLLINPNQGEFALLIRNPHLANTITTLHRYIWDRYRN